MSLSSVSILITALKQLADYQPLDEHPRDIAIKALDAYERLKHNGLGEVFYRENPATSITKYDQLLRQAEVTKGLLERFYLYSTEPDSTLDKDFFEQIKMHLQKWQEFKKEQGLE